MRLANNKSGEMEHRELLRKRKKLRSLIYRCSYLVQRKTIFVHQAFSISASSFRLHNLLCAVGGLAASPGIYPRDVISIHYHQLGHPKMSPAIAKCPWKKNCSSPPTPWRTAACGTMILQSDPQTPEGCQDLYKVFSC